MVKFVRGEKLETLFAPSRTAGLSVGRCVRIVWSSCQSLTGRPILLAQGIFSSFLLTLTEYDRNQRNGKVRGMRQGMYVHVSWECGIRKVRESRGTMHATESGKDAEEVKEEKGYCS